MKLKDYITLGNLLSGFAAVIALFFDRFALACYLICLAYVFDVLDGPVARLTRQLDSFGGILDSVCDFVTNSIFMSFLVFHFFWRQAGWPVWVAAVVGAFPAALGTIRQARQQDRPLTYPCYWIGLPRPVLALFILALLNSSLVALASGPVRPWVNGFLAALIVGGSLLHLSHIPFVNHHERRFMTFLRLGAWVFLLGAPLMLGVSLGVFKDGRLFFDHLLFCFFIYLGLAWTQIPYQDVERLRALRRGEPLRLPLVHRDSAWRPRTWAPFFLERDAEDSQAVER